MSVFVATCADFPSFLCARERLLVSRIPVFNLRESRKSFSSDDDEQVNAKAATKKQQPKQLHAQQQRFLPAVSVFHATECQFNQDFTQMALKITSTFGMTGWVNASFHETLIVVEDPRQQDRWRHPVYMQNVATKAGKWMGELPVRGIPSLQAPRLGNNVESYRILEAVERKLVKDQVWIKIRNFASSAEPAAAASVSESGGGDNQESERDESGNADDNKETTKSNDSETKPALTEAWIIERNVNTGERVTVPWGSDCIKDEPNSDHEERFYRNVYSRRPLPLRKSPELSAEIVGQVDPGAVFSSSMRVLNAQGRMWIRVPLSSDENPQDAKNFGYAIQSNAKTNRCMLQEIAAPGKMASTQYFQVVVTSSTSSSPEASESGSNMVVVARAEPLATAKELFAVKRGAIVTVLGSQYVREERRMWLQVLAADIDSAMRVRQENVVLSDEEQHQNVVYLPVCDPSSPVDVVLRPIYRQLVKIPNPSVTHSEEKKSSARVVFSGRASKLFGSQLMQSSTIDLPALSKKKETSVSMGPAAAAAGETQSQSQPNDPAQALKDEINSWQVESEHLSVISTYVSSGLSRLTQCLQRPFSSCLAKKEAMQKYEQLYQQDEEEDDLEYGRLAPDVRV